LILLLFGDCRTSPSLTNTTTNHTMIPQIKLPADQVISLKVQQELEGVDATEVEAAGEDDEGAASVQKRVYKAVLEGMPAVLALMRAEPTNAEVQWWCCDGIASLCAGSRTCLSPPRCCLCVCWSERERLCMGVSVSVSVCALFRLSPSRCTKFPLLRALPHEPLCLPVFCLRVVLVCFAFVFVWVVCCFGSCLCFGWRALPLLTAENRQACDAGGGPELIIATLKAFPSDTNVQLKGCWAVSNLSGDLSEKLGNLDGVEAVVAALRSSDLYELQSVAVRTLKNLCEASANARRARTHNAREAVQAVADAHPDDGELVYRCTTLIKMLKVRVVVWCVSCSYIFFFLWFCWFVLFGCLNFVGWLPRAGDGGCACFVFVFFFILLQRCGSSSCCTYVVGVCGRD